MPKTLVMPREYIWLVRQLRLIAGLTLARVPLLTSSRRDTCTIDSTEYSLKLGRPFLTPTIHGTP